MTTIDALVAFLLARLDEREKVARAASGVHWKRGAPNDAADWDPDEKPWRDDYNGISEADPPHETVVYDEGRPNDGQLDHIALNDPARVLADVEAKRRIVENPPVSPDAIAEWEDTVKILAEVDADHPDYDEAWRP